MTVYHGSIDEVRSPDTSHSKRFLDFGCGFYVTSFREQAERWAQRKFLRSNPDSGISPVVNEYELLDAFDGFNILRFSEVGEEWFDFVCACRKGDDVAQGRDAIVGRVANDDVFKTIQKFQQGRMTKQEAIKELRYAKPNDQIAFCNDTVIRACLKFVRSYRLEVRG